jgi:RNA polymerase sigma factor (sigma-70 family)
MELEIQAHTTQTLVATLTDPHTGLAERHDAFEQLVMSFEDMAYGCAYALLGNYHHAEEAAQEAFAAAWQKIHQLREPAAFPGWFRRILHTECSRIRRRSNVAASPIEDENQIRVEGDDPHKLIETSELKAAVHDALGTLPTGERTVVALFYLRQHSHTEISAFLGLPPTTVAKRLYSARQRLKGLLMSKFKKELVSKRPSRSSTFADKVRSGLYDEYVGRYRFDERPELIVTIERDGETLIGEAAGQRNVLLQNGRKKNELNTREFDGRGRFIRNRRGRITHLVYYEFGQEMGTAKKIG